MGRDSPARDLPAVAGDLGEIEIMEEAIDGRLVDRPRLQGLPRRGDMSADPPLKVAEKADLLGIVPPVDIPLASFDKRGDKRRSSPRPRSRRPPERPTPTEPRAGLSMWAWDGLSKNPSVNWARRPRSLPYRTRPTLCRRPLPGCRSRMVGIAGSAGASPSQIQVFHDGRRPLAKSRRFSLTLPNFRFLSEVRPRRVPI